MSCSGVDYARCLKKLADVYFPDATRFVLVRDNLNTHYPCSLYEAFSPAEARRRIKAEQDVLENVG